MTGLPVPDGSADTTVTKFLASNETAVTKYLEQNDVSVTKFMEMVITNFLLDDRAVGNLLGENELMENDYVEVKFLEQNGDISVTKFLHDYDANYYDEDEWSYENDLMDNDTLANGKKKKKTKK